MCSFFSPQHKGNYRALLRNAFRLQGDFYCAAA